MINYRCYFLDQCRQGKAMAFQASTDTDAVCEAESLISGDRGQLERFEVWDGNRLVYRRGHQTNDA